MPTYLNAGYNNPALGQALGNLGSLFAGPTPQEQLVAQTLQAQRAQAAQTAAARAQLSPHLQALGDYYGADAAKMAAGAQLELADKGAPIGAQGAYGYARDGQFGNTPQAKATVPLSQGQTLAVAPGTPGFGTPDPTTGITTLSNEKADTDQSTDTLKAKILAGLGMDAQQKWALSQGNGGVSVSVGGQNDAAKNIATQVDNSYTSAKAAQASLPVFDRQEAALNKGVITGTGSDLIQKARGVLSTITGVNDPGLEHTQDFVAAAQQNIGNLAKQISGSGHTTNMDINVAKMIEGGDPNYTNSALHEIIRQRRLVSLDQIGAHNTLVDQYAHAYPGSADAAGFYRLSQPSTAYPPADRITSDNAPQPDAANGGGPTAPGPAAPVSPTARLGAAIASPGSQPAALSPFNANGVVGGAAAPAAGAPPTLSAAAAGAAAPGTTFRGSDGNLYRVPAAAAPNVVPGL